MLPTLISFHGGIKFNSYSTPETSSPHSISHSKMLVLLPHEASQCVCGSFIARVVLMSDFIYFDSILDCSSGVHLKIPFPFSSEDEGEIYLLRCIRKWMSGPEVKRFPSTGDFILKSS